jgi:hypothetical protein
LFPSFLPSFFLSFFLSFLPATLLHVLPSFPTFFLSPPPFPSLRFTLLFCLVAPDTPAPDATLHPSSHPPVRPSVLPFFRPSILPLSSSLSLFFRPSFRPSSLLPLTHSPVRPSFHPVFLPLSRGTRYTCPRCNSPYCSVKCFQEHSLQCTESFFKVCMYECMYICMYAYVCMYINVCMYQCINMYVCNIH